MNVKPLEWSSKHGLSSPFIAATPFGIYRIERTDDGYSLFFCCDELMHIGFDSCDRPALSEARDAGQADYAARIRALHGDTA